MNYAVMIGNEPVDEFETKEAAQAAIDSGAAAKIVGTIPAGWRLWVAKWSNNMGWIDAI